MSYYHTIEEDLARAKEILARGKPDPPLDSRALGDLDLLKQHEVIIEGDQAWSDGGHDLLKQGQGTIYGADIYAAYKLLESFVAEIEQHLTIPRFDLLEDPQRGLHAVLTRYGVASRTDYQPLVTALVQWAAAAYRSSAESFVAEIERLRLTPGLSARITISGPELQEAARTPGAWGRHLQTFQCATCGAVMSEPSETCVVCRGTISK